MNVYESCVRGTQGDTIYDALSLLSANYLYYEDASAMNTLYWGAGTGYTVLINSERSYMARVVKIVPVIGYVLSSICPHSGDDAVRSYYDACLRYTRMVI